MINIAQLKDLSRAKKYPKGMEIIKDGDPVSREMYILLKGSAGVYKHFGTPRELHIARISAGEFFGEMSLFLSLPRTAAVVALEDCVCLPITPESALDFVRSEPEATLTLLKSVCGRLLDLNQVYERLCDEKVSPPLSEEELPLLPEEEPSFLAEEPETLPESPPPTMVSSTLFPEGHTGYALPLKNTDNPYLYEKGFTCPVCKTPFRTIQVKGSKLVQEKTDPDMRVHYKGVEPMHYEVVSCPHCWYSALSENFDGVSLRAERLAMLKEQLQHYKKELSLPFGASRDGLAVFAGYYLALLCAPICFPKPEILLAKLYVKLSRLYGDAGDEGMEAYAAQKALENYRYVYERTNVSNAHSQQICVMIGELSMKLKDYKTARTFFFRARTEKEGSPVLKKHAGGRAYDLSLLTGEPVPDEDPEAQE